MDIGAPVQQQLYGLDVAVLRGGDEACRAVLHADASAGLWAVIKGAEIKGAMWRRRRCMAQVSADHSADARIYPLPA